MFMLWTIVPSACSTTWILMSSVFKKLQENHFPSNMKITTEEAYAVQVSSELTNREASQKNKEWKYLQLPILIHSVFIVTKFIKVFIGTVSNSSHL